MRKILLITLCTLLQCTVFAQSAELTVKKIMQDPKTWIGTSPSAAYWSEDGKTLYFNWNPENNPGDSLYKIPSTGGTPIKVSLSERKALPARGGNYNKTKTQKVYAQYGDIFLHDIKLNKTTQLTNTIAIEGSPAFTADGKSITFISDNNLFLLNLANGSIKQMTDFRQGAERRERKKSAQDEWLENDNIALIEVLQERKEKSEQRNEYNKLLQVKRPKNFMLDGRFVGNITISPKQDFITFTLTKRAESNNTIVPNYVAQSGYTENLNTRAKVGSAVNDQLMGIYNLDKDSIYFLKVDDLPGLDQQPEFKKDYLSANKAAKRGVITQAPVWSEDGNYLVTNIRSKDNKDRWIVLVDLQNASTTVLDHQHDEAWIAGPGIGWTFGGDLLGFMPDNKRIYFQSEASGYSHLYTLDVSSKNKKALTSGNYEVYSPQISQDIKYWYFEANINHPGERRIYYLPLEGGTPIAITPEVGGHSGTFSPDESKIAVLFSTSNKPTELFIVDNPLKSKKATRIQITKSTKEEFNAYPWREAEVITFKASDGVDVYSRIYKPEASKQNGAAVIFVHGAGYLQNAHKWWSTYFREYMFHNLLTDLGYTVLDIDYRGSAGYGRDCRTGIYRHMGGKDLSDHVDGAAYLVKEHGVDPKRIGLYGGSYGGFITLMAMFTEPDVFAAGAALRSVTDWAHYNHGYTSNILNTPVEDSIAYRKSSPIYYAEGLKGALLICHGIIDTNVHFQDVVRLAQRLIELEKENWEFAVYPLEDHGFVEPSSWTDEYRRILKLFEDNLR
jgi:dipeptidyl aminopeptidase/acylaminoacyl peptidase